MLKPKASKRAAAKEPMKGQRVNNRVNPQDRRVPTRTWLPKMLYRLTMPGGMLLLILALMAHAGLFADTKTPFVRFYSYFVFGIGLLISAYFKRSRLFFAILVVVLAERTLGWLAPGFLSAKVSKSVFEAIALLLPLNLLALTFMRDRGIISPAGKQRIAFIAFQVIAVGIVSVPAQVYAATVLDHAFIDRHLVQWSSIS